MLTHLGSPEQIETVGVPYLSGGETDAAINGLFIADAGCVGIEIPDRPSVTRMRYQ
ncbi:MAG: hypothetical protein ACK5Q5_02080 [Planctomycetaceae bacterium]